MTVTVAPQPGNLEKTDGPRAFDHIGAVDDEIRGIVARELAALRRSFLRSRRSEIKDSSVKVRPLTCRRHGR